MSDLEKVIDSLTDFYRKLTKPFSFEMNFCGVDSVVHVFISSKTSLTEKKIPYEANFIIVAEGQIPVSMIGVSLSEEQLVSKNHIFLDDEDMFNSVVDDIKTHILDEAERLSEEDSYFTVHYYKPAMAGYDIALALLYDEYKNDDGFILKVASSCEIINGYQGFFDRILTNKEKTEREEWLPESVIKNIKKLRELLAIPLDNNDVNNKTLFYRPDRTYYNEFLLSEMRKHIDIYREMPVDWEVLSVVHNEQTSFRNSEIKDKNWSDKYKKFALGPKVVIDGPDGQKIINPRREFFINYPILANSSIIMSDELLEMIDALKPIEGVRLFFPNNRNIDFKLTKGILKYLNRKHLKHGVFVEMFFMFLSIIPVEWMPELSDKVFSSTYEMDDLNEFMGLLSYVDITFSETVVDKDVYIRAIDCHISDYLKKIYKAYIPSRHDVFVSPEMDKKYDVILAEFVNSKTLPRTVSERRKQFKELSREMKKFVSKRASELSLETHAGYLSSYLSKMKSWFRIKYMLTPTDEGMAGSEITGTIYNISDSYDMFCNKVLNPICVLLSDKDDVYSLGNKDYNLIDSIFNSNRKSKSLPKIVKMSIITHEQGDYFIGAGNDPASLVHEKNEDDATPFTAYSKELEKDNIRELAGISSHADWVPLITKIFSSYKKNFHIIPLMSSKQLVEEGNAMDNCVGWGGYANKSSMSESKIFSVRDENLNRVATLEIELNHREKTISILQLYGLKNKPVEKAVSYACDFFVRQVNEGKVNTHWDELLKEKKKAASGSARGSIISHQAGYFPTEEAIRKAMVPWKRFLPKKLYDAPFSDWLYNPGVRSIVNKINKKNSKILKKPNGDTFKFGYNKLDINQQLYSE